MSDTHLELWKFSEAPSALRDLIPSPYTDGIVVFVVPGSAIEVIEYLIARWTLMGFAIFRHNREDGSIVLAGPDRSAIPLN